jgi:hypothetical protein
LVKAVDGGVCAVKACLEHLCHTDDQQYRLHDLARYVDIPFGVKIGGPTANYDAVRVREAYHPHFIVAPIVESVYTAKMAAQVAQVAGAKCDMMLETVGALHNPELWSEMSRQARVVIFGMSDIEASGGGLQDIGTPYKYLNSRGVLIAFGGQMTPRKAADLLELFPAIYAIETRLCRVEVLEGRDISKAVEDALLFDAYFYSASGRDDIADMIYRKAKDK